ncbi:MAG TPA: hypothetical protein VK031_00480 [Tissierellaceae bacterium]|nr:hypothetical protein [Tissierellaceae bacterium]
MIRVYFIWAILATILAGIFVWRYETKKCIETHITNIADTAIIYIPYHTGLIEDGKPGLKPAAILPSLLRSNKSTSVAIIPNIGYSPYGPTFGIQGVYMKNNWSVSYNYDFILRSHSIGFGWRF